MHDHRKLRVWVESCDLAVAVYQLTRLLPKSEQFGLLTQMRRAAVSIPSNIAEGASRGSPKDFRRFLSIAAGSAAELSTQLHLIQRLGFALPDDLRSVEAVVTRVMRSLRRLSSTLEADD